MFQSHPFHTFCLSLVAAAGISACAVSPVGSAVTVQVPEQLQPPAGMQLASESSAVGVQIYTCIANKSDPTRFEWNFQAPQAELLDADGRKIGTHYAGPTWKANDGSTVVGEVKVRHDAPVGSAIPWLLLSAKANSGNGTYGKVAFIQRLATEGGKAPADGCAKASVGTELQVPYKAIYRYYTAGR